MKIIFALLLISYAGLAVGQTKTTTALDEKYEGLSLYFYKNTLRMLNQTDDKEFDELIKDIEKMKFLMIDKNESKFSKEDYSKLLAGYKSESYEEMMTSRFEGRNFDVYLREKDGDVKGTIILANDSTSLFVLDILGKIALDKAPALFKTIDGSTDIGKKIKDFTGRNEKDEKKSDDKNDNNQDN
jgi:Domain of unknown function (DUF4252)